MKKFILTLLAGFSVLAAAQSPSTAQQSINNLIPNGGFENGRAKWGTFQTTLVSGVPTTAPAVCSSCSITITPTTTGAINGKTSLAVASSAATTVGHGFLSNAFPVSPGAAVQVLTERANYSVTTNVQNVNLSGTTANSWAMYIYELPSGTWTQPTGAFGMTVVSGSLTPATFQPLSGTTSIRVAMVAVNATAGAHSILWDDFFVGVQSQSVGPAMADMKPFVASGSWTSNTTYLGQYSRTGDRVSGKISVSVTGTPGPGNLVLNFIPGLTIDYSKMPLGGQRAALGRCDGLGAGGTAFTYEVEPAGANFTQMEVTYQNGTNATLNSVSATTPFTWAATHFMNCAFYDVPVVGFSTNVSQSSDYDGRNLNMVASGSGKSIAANVDFPMDVVSTDKGGSWNGTQYRVQAAGDFTVASWIQGNAQPYGSAVMVNGVTKFGACSYITNVFTSSICAATLNDLKVGDLISLRGVLNGTGVTFTSGGMSITYAGGKQLIQQSPSVAASYGATAAQTVSGVVPVKYETKITDTANICSTMATTGLCTLNMPGTWEVSIVTYTASTGGQPSLFLGLNGANPAGYLATPNNLGVWGGSVIFSATQGTTVGVYVDSNSVGLPAIGTKGFLNRFNIKRVGN